MNDWSVRYLVLSGPPLGRCHLLYFITSSLFIMSACLQPSRPKLGAIHSKVSHVEQISPLIRSPNIGLSHSQTQKRTVSETIPLKYLSFRAPL